MRRTSARSLLLLRLVKSCLLRPVHFKWRLSGLCIVNFPHCLRGSYNLSPLPALGLLSHFHSLLNLLFDYLALQLVSLVIWAFSILQFLIHLLVAFALVVLMILLYHNWHQIYVHLLPACISMQDTGVLLIDDLLFLLKDLGRPSQLR